MAPLIETASAKVNLTLRVLGRRSDGFHELSSLVAFAKLGDTLQLEPGDELSLAVRGSFSAKLDEDNLVLHAARLLSELCRGVRTGAFILEKNLPVAAGLGGGSADAGAALRLIGRANPGLVTGQIMEEAACRLGSDVLACLMSHAAMMRGRGEKLLPLERLPALDAVLVNPGIPLAAGDVYAALEAPELEDNFVPDDVSQISFASVGEVLKHISKAGNDLQHPAIKLAPVISDVLSALSCAEGCETAQMSGSGSTCFGVFANAGHAAGARDRLHAAHPDWWVVSTRLA
ncbi:MAG: 4-(cytidine 5'-diphospho)-2-C-methyl-D-erythritol kinase [Alphaproteobacteria bacterium]